ncbi:MAG: hypothetical protein ACREDQ_12595, partial [Limisphaerales bacterium]
MSSSNIAPRVNKKGAQEDEIFDAAEPVLGLYSEAGWFSIKPTARMAESSTDTPGVMACPPLV